MTTVGWTLWILPHRATIGSTFVDTSFCDALNWPGGTARVEKHNSKQGCTVGSILDLKFRFKPTLPSTTFSSVNLSCQWHLHENKNWSRQPNTILCQFFFFSFLPFLGWLFVKLWLSYYLENLTQKMEKGERGLTAHYKIESQLSIEALGERQDQLIIRKIHL